jgi:membrane fusion protein
MDNSREQLFRSQATLGSRQLNFGRVLISQPISNYVLTLLLVVVVALIAMMLGGGAYARKETVSGYLSPRRGFSKIYATRSGIIEAVHVSEGQSVQKGSPLLTVLVEQFNSDGRDVTTSILHELAGQISEIDAAIVRHSRISEREENRLTGLIDTLTTEEAELLGLKNLQIHRFELFLQQYRAVSRLHETGHLSELDWLEYRSRYLGEKQKIEASNRQIVQTRNRLSEIRFQLVELPDTRNNTLTELRIRRSILHQQQTELQGHRNYRIDSPVAGRVTALQAKRGQAVIPSSPQLFILPSDSALEGSLLIPTRARGFVQPAQDVRLLYDAFPYQSFGVYKGTINNLSKTILVRGEVSGPLQIQEPVYIATIELNRQTIDAYGKEMPLQPGMLLKADIILEERSIFEWLLEPLYSLRGRT